MISKKCTSFKIQPPKKGQFCPANSWAGLPFLFFSSSIQSGEMTG
ncbi:hypothetical protein RUMCAL_02081, partial [Ruminococcus callidus ATCC 27760]